MPVIDEACQAAPAARLAPYVAGYSGYRQAGVAPEIHRGLPSPYLTFIVTLDDPLVVVRHPDPAAPGGSFGTLLGGLHTNPALVAHGGFQSGVQISLRPLGARALFGLPAGALAGVDVEATDVGATWVAELHDRVRAAAGWRARFAAVDAVLGAALQPVTVAPELRRAWGLCTLAGRPVASVADDVGWSVRRLSDRFGREFGLPPSAAVRVARFDRARRTLQRSAPRVTIARVAADTGYYDQAHLAREFRDLAGIAPSGWLAEMRRSVQAESVLPVAGSPP